MKKNILIGLAGVLLFNTGALALTNSDLQEFLDMRTYKGKYTNTKVVKQEEILSNKAEEGIAYYWTAIGTKTSVATGKKFKQNCKGIINSYPSKEKKNWFMTIECRKIQ